MSDDNASFEVELRDGTSRNAKKIAAALRDVHKAASGKGLAAAEKSMKRTERAARSYAVRAKKSAKVNPFGEFGKNTGVFRSRGHVNQMWDAMVTGQRKFANEQRRPMLVQAAKRRAAQMDGLKGAGRGAVGLAGGAMVAGGAAGLVGGFAAYQTSSASLDAVKFRDEALTGLKLITGSTSEANRVFEESVALSDKLGQEWRTTVGGMQKLLGKGFEEDFAKDMTRGLADLSIVAPDANVSNLLLAIGQIKNAGKLQGDELNQLTEAGLNSNLMFNVLQERLGKSREEVLKLKEAGKLMADDVLPAILESIQRLTGKELGMAAEEASATLAGSMRKLEQLPGRFFLAVAEDLDKSRLEGSLKDLVGALDPESDAFAKGVEFVSDTVVSIAETVDAVTPAVKEFGIAFADAFMAFEGIEDKDYRSITETFKDPEVIESIRTWGELLGNVAAALGQIVKLVGFGTAILPMAAKSVGDIFNPLSGTDSSESNGRRESEVSSSGEAMGAHMATGFWGALFAGTDEARAGGVALANAAEEGMRSREGADIHSPSKKTKKIAAYMTGGLVGGLSVGARAAETAGQELGSAPVRGMSANLSEVAQGGASLGVRSSSSSLPDVRQGSAVPAKSSASSMQIGDVSIALSNLPEDATKNPEALARAIRRELQGLFDGIVQQGTIQVDADA